LRSVSPYSRQMAFKKSQGGKPEGEGLPPEGLAGRLCGEMTPFTSLVGLPNRGFRRPMG
jgi:hypothetical protein